jgi:hypothetical protein
VIDAARPCARRPWRIVVSALAGVVGAVVVGSAAHAQDLDTETVSDSGATTTVRLVVLVLVVLGLALTAVTVWFWRATRPDHPALGPLEVMSSRRFARLGDLEQQRRLDAARPEGAEPERRSRSAIAAEERGRKLAAELQELVESTPEGFDDLDVEPVPDLSPPSVPASGAPS